MHDESTDSNTDASAARTNTANTEADTNTEDSKSGGEEMIPAALSTAFTASAVSDRDTSSLLGELLSKHTLHFRNTGTEKSKGNSGVDTE
jgi:hypothetical protein